MSTNVNEHIQSGNTSDLPVLPQQLMLPKYPESTEHRLLNLKPDIPYKN